ncbi:Aste57867_1288 [Aphanomyces stellatus]|uniref:Aste57867_1288 protein n=1 Tax=Aphanomyces stellatus TaxID=120398 RepID=A0A485KA99_9STRA|nr:hypothetical protein As57867_001287 [Aphanomyces stellatus]VFT78507.1 Aste57867_1288 [Aphanomyces stellatus]
MGMPRVVPWDTVCPDSSSLKPETQRLALIVENLAGTCYVLGSLFCSFYYVRLLPPFLTNDLWWPNLNMTGGQSYLIDLVNSQLAVNGSSWAIEGVPLQRDYSSPFTPMYMPQAYGRRVLLESTDMTMAIKRLLRMSVAEIKALPTQYCWVDMDRRWSLARTPRRQARCLAADGDNAAVYLEAPLRVTDWWQWQTQMGSLFQTAIVDGLLPKDAGNAWVTMVSTTRVSDASTEAAYWHTKSMTRFTFQWQNYQQDWLDESIRVVTAVSSQVVLLKRYPYFRQNLDGLLARNNMWQYAQTWPPSQSLVVPATGDDDQFNAYVGAMELNLRQSSSSPFIEVVENDLGPFVSIDMRYVSAPPSLVALYNDFLRQMDSIVLHLPIQLSQYALLDPLPHTWAAFPNVTYFGGNPLCHATTNTDPGLQLSFGFDDTCRGTGAFQLSLSPLTAAFALYVTGMSNAMAYQACALCGTTASLCREIVLKASAVVTALNTTNDSLVQAALPDIQSIEIIQFALVYGMMNSTAEALLLRQSLVGGSASTWRIFGWTMLLDWLQCNREVVTIEGDVASLTLLSKVYNPLAFEVQPSDIPRSMGAFYWFMTAYVSLVLAGVATVACLYGVICARGSFRGRNLFRLNRVVSSVWVGRPLTVARGLSAMMLLSCATLDLQVDPKNGWTSFVAVRRSWLDSLVVSGEAMWVQYVLHDIVLIGTDHAHRYAPLSTALAWMVVSSLDLFVPPTASTTWTHRDCDPIAFGLTCTVETILIGNFTRLCLPCAVFAASTLGSLWWVKWQSTQDARPKIEPLVLPASAVAYFDMHLPSSATYKMDVVACVLAGLVPLRTSHSQSFLLDIKLWRRVPCTFHDRMVEIDNPRFVQTVHEAKTNGSGPTPTTPITSIAIIPTLVSLFRRTVFPVKVGPLVDTVAPTQNGSCRRSTPPPWHQFLAVVAFVYLISSVASSLYFVAVAQTSIANDFFWAHFNSTGTQAYLANWFNYKLVASTSAILFDRLDFVDTSLYNDTDVIIPSSSLYPSHVQLEARSNLTNVILGLRSLQLVSSLWLSTSYCWLDFGRQWEMAVTETRQKKRCLSDGLDNGAMYLESMLRNTDPNLWLHNAYLPCAGAFAIAVSSELDRTNEGRQWWAAMQRLWSVGPLPLQDEVTLWMDQGLTHYQCQWQNYKSLGIVDTFDVRNAAGTAYPITIKHSAYQYHFTTQTSLKAHGSLANDLFLGACNGSGTVGGSSLLRSSPQFLYANMSIQDKVHANDPSMDIAAPPFLLVDNVVGPFGTIDTMHVPRPSSLVSLFDTINTAMLAMLSEDNNPASKQFLALSSMSWTLKGYQRLETNPSISLLSGDILCPTTTLDVASHHPLSGLLESFGQSDGCSAPKPATLTVDRAMLVFATLAWQHVNPTRQVQSPNASFLCSGGNTDPKCTAALASIPSIALSSVAFVDNLSAATTYKDVHRLNVSLVQIAADIDSLSLLHLPLFDPGEPDFEFLAWCLLSDWVLGRREVVSFEGDYGTFVLVSSEYPMSIWHASPTEIPSNIVYYVRGTIIYVTSLLTLVAMLVLVYTVVDRGWNEPRNVLSFGRVAGIVWVGRPLLFLRSLTAIGLLSTAKVEFVQDSLGLSRMMLPARDGRYYINSILSSSEACWLVYVVQDIFTVAASNDVPQLTSHVSLLVWFVSASLSCFYPVQPTVDVHRACELSILDFQVTCHSGHVAIGDVTRFVMLLGLVVSVAFAAFGFQELFNRRSLAMSTTTSHFLSNCAQLHFKNRAHWQYEGVSYIDHASAAMNGLLIFSWRWRFYVLDVKTWRVYEVATPECPHFCAAPYRFHVAFPLTD